MKSVFILFQTYWGSDDMNHKDIVKVYKDFPTFEKMKADLDQDYEVLTDDAYASLKADGPNVKLESGTKISIETWRVT